MLKRRRNNSESTISLSMQNYHNFMCQVEDSDDHEQALVIVNGLLLIILHYWCYDPDHLRAHTLLILTSSVSKPYIRITMTFVYRRGGVTTPTLGARIGGQGRLYPHFLREYIIYVFDLVSWYNVLNMCYEN